MRFTSCNRRSGSVRGVKPPAELTYSLEAGLEASERVLNELGLLLGHSMRRDNER